MCKCIIGKCLHFNGIDSKMMELFYKEGDIKLYNLKSKKEEWDSLYIELKDKHMFNIGRIKYIDELIAEIKEIGDIEEFIKTEFLKELQKDKTISLGIAEYLGVKDDAIKHNKQVHLQRLKEQEEKKKQEEQEEKERKEKVLNNAISRFREGKYISGDDFVMLCDYYNIKLPIKTRGWCLNSLVRINNKTYTYSGNNSTVISEYMNELSNILSA